MKEERFKTEVRTDFDYSDIPVEARFIINKKDAEEIVRLSRLVKDNGLCQVEKFDYSASFLNKKARGWDKAKWDTERMDSNCLCVDDNSFCYSAYIKHTNVEVRTERIKIKNLSKHFGLVLRG